MSRYSYNTNAVVDLTTGSVACDREMNNE